MKSFHDPRTGFNRAEWDLLKEVDSIRLELKLYVEYNYYEGNPQYPGAADRVRELQRQLYEKWDAIYAYWEEEECKKERQRESWRLRKPPQK